MSVLGNPLIVGSGSSGSVIVTEELDEHGGIIKHITTSGDAVTVSPLSVTSNGTYNAGVNQAYNPVTVNVSGGGGDDDNDVLFVDYDGTVVHSYTSAEFAQLSAMPSNPSHTGLTAQGWNWDLSDAKTYVSKYGKLCVGQYYTTVSEATEIDITLPADYLYPRLCYSGASSSTTVTIDWGDGSATESVTGSGAKYADHTYAAAGNYTIKVTCTAGTLRWTQGSYSYASVLLDGGFTPGYSSINYSACITAIRLGKNTVFGYNSFANLINLRTITIPKNSGDTLSNTSGTFYRCFNLITAFVVSTSSGSNTHNYIFQYCSSLLYAPLPYGVTRFAASTFSHCYSLKMITLPSTMTTLDSGSQFTNCLSLKAAVIPDSISTASTNTSSLFYLCYNLNYVYLTKNASVTVFPSSCFSYNAALTSFTISSNYTSISSSAFSFMTRLKQLTIPSSVTDIAVSAFSTISSLEEMHFKPTTPPTVANSNAFSGLPRSCKIYVPTGYLSAYTSASNYPSSANYTYIEE